MKTYVYETIPQTPGARTRHYQIEQNPGDAPLTVHPQTGEPIRPVVLGDLGELTLPDQKRKTDDNSRSSRSCVCGRLPWLRDE
jgi:hypothetical protein